MYRFSKKIYNMNHLLLICFLSLFLIENTLAQNDLKYLQQTLDILFTHLGNGDEEGVYNLFLPGQSDQIAVSYLDNNNKLNVEFDLQRALPIIPTESILAEEIKWITGAPLATAHFKRSSERIEETWNVSFVKFNENDWRITQIQLYLKRGYFSLITDEIQIETVLNKWHHAAAIADEDTFFGLMMDNAIYLGTDASERWLRDELKVWSEKYFQRESAWTFHPFNRNITCLPANNKIAYFDEQLNTGMGPCRGSGVLTKTQRGWRILQYNLTFVVPNDKVKGLQALLKEK